MYVSDWMTKKVFSVEPDDYLSDALSLMKEKKHQACARGQGRKAQRHHL